MYNMLKYSLIDKEQFELSFPLHCFSIIHPGKC